MALPRKGLRGVEKIADTTAWTNSMAESGGAQVKDHLRNMCTLLYVTSAVWVQSHTFNTLKILSHRRVYKVQPTLISMN